MPITVLIWAALFVVGLVGTFFSPIFGLAGYLLEYYQRPTLNWWGSHLPNLRWNFTIAAALTASFLLRRSSLPPVRAMSVAAPALLLALGLDMLLVNTWAVAPDLSWHWVERFWKTILIYYLIIGIVRRQWQFDAFLVVNMIGAAWWGFDALGMRRTNNRLEGVGSADTLNSNALGAHLLTIIPAIIIFIWVVKDRRLRLIALACLPFVLNMFILANSRGATLGLFAAGLAAFLLVRFKQRRHVLMGVAASALAVYLLADPAFISRQETTAQAQDSSAQTRLQLWSGALRMIADHPEGVGGRGFHVLSPQYAPGTAAEDADLGRSAHNTYLQMTAEWGVLGFLMFSGFLLTSLVYLHRVRRESMAPDWFYYRSLAIELGLIGTLVAGFFSVRFYGESIYWWAGLAAALTRIPRCQDPPHDGRLGRENDLMAASIPAAPEGRAHRSARLRQRSTAPNLR